MHASHHTTTMIERLPQEILDAIVNQIPDTCGDESCPEKKTSLAVLGCTLVNRAFGAAARRQLFSTIHITMYSEPLHTGRKLKRLLDLLQSSEGILSMIQIFSLKLMRKQISDKNDMLLDQIIHIFQTSDSLFRVCITGDGYSKSNSINTLGPLSKQAILNLLSRIDEISLWALQVPHNFFQFSPVLGPTNSSVNTVVKSINTLHGSQSRVEQAFKPLAPSFRKARFYLEKSLLNVVMSQVLSKSMNTLTTLEMYVQTFRH